MRGLGSFIGPPPRLGIAWPERLNLADPYAGDEVLPDPAPYADYLDHAPGASLPQDEFRRWDDRFMAEYRGVLDGRMPWGSTDQAAVALSLAHPNRHDRRPPHRAPQVLPDGLLSDIAENWLPDIGLLAPDRVLGPFADEPLPRAIRRTAGALFAFAPVLEPKLRPIGRAIRLRAELTTDQRSSLKAVRYAPSMLWDLSGTVPRAVLPLGARYQPDQVVHGLPDTPAAIARLLPGPDGWWASVVLPLPALPPVAPQLRRLELEQRRLRRHERRMSWEDLLRERPEVLYRTTCEWLWLHEQDSTLACWRRWAARPQASSSSAP